MTTQRHDLWAILPEALATRLGDGAAGGQVRDGDNIDVGAGPMAQTRNGDTVAVGAGLRPAPTNADHADGPGYALRGPVAVVHISGTLVHADPGGGDTTYSDAATAVRAAATDPAARAVILRINSPGGTVAGVEELVGAVRYAGKPVYAYTDAVMASAAYWVGAQALGVGAARTAQVGSIGVVATHADFSKLMDRVGIKISYITSGRYKAMGNPAEPLGDEARGYIQERIDAVYRVFLGDVAGARGLALDSAEAWADGRVFPADAAKAAGLVDRVEGFHHFLRHVIEETKMDTSDFKAQHPEAWQQARDEGIQEANAAAAARIDQAVAEARSKERAECAALAAAVCGPEAAARIAAMQAAGVTAQQVEALRAAGVFAAPQDDAASRMAILEGLTASANPPVGVAAPPEKPREDNPNLPVEERAKAAWDNTPDIRIEFNGNFDAYLALRRAEELGRVRIMGK